MTPGYAQRQEKQAKIPGFAANATVPYENDAWPKRHDCQGQCIYGRACQNLARTNVPRDILEKRLEATIT